MLLQLKQILKRRIHYRTAFESQSGREVLADLKRFCRAGESPLQVSNGSTDEFATAVRIGRQEVFNRIAHFINISDEDLVNLKENYDETIE